MKPAPVHDAYVSYTRRKAATVVTVAVLTLVAAIYAMQAGSADLSMRETVRALLGMAEGSTDLVVWNIRLPRVIGAVAAGAGLSLAGAVMQSVLRNPLASPFTLGISQGAAFGAALAIVGFGAGVTGSSALDAVTIGNAWSVTGSAFVSAMAATIAVVAIGRMRGTTPQTLVLAGVALGSLFSAGTVLLQYFAEDTQVAAIVFWTFGDLGRASWRDVAIMTAVVVIGASYFMLHRWDYNALEAGADSARSLGVNVERVRIAGMFVAALVTSSLVAFLGIIGFIGLVGPHLMRRVLGNDHRFLLPAAAGAGALLLLVSDTLARTIVSPVILPVGAITSFLGAPLFLYLLVTRRDLR